VIVSEGIEEVAHQHQDQGGDHDDGQAQDAQAPEVRQRGWPGPPGIKYGAAQWM
jgi:hypothetical protein